MLFSNKSINLASEINILHCSMLNHMLRYASKAHVTSRTRGQCMYRMSVPVTTVYKYQTEAGHIGLI